MLASSRYLKPTQPDQPELIRQGLVSFKGNENQDPNGLSAHWKMPSNTTWNF